MLLKREREALGLAELLTSSIYKVKALKRIAEVLRGRSSQEEEWLGVFMRVSEIALLIEDSDQREKMLRELATVLVEAQQWELAEAVIGKIRG